VSLDDAWLDAANPADLDALAHALLDGRVGGQFSRGSIQLAGFGEGAARFLDGVRGTAPHVVAWMLQRLSRERSRADDRYASVASLVWSGASEGQQGIRDTKVVLDGIFSRAESHVLIATYVIYDGLSVFARLADRLRERPEIQVDLYVNLPSESGRDDEEAADVEHFIQSFERKHWPHDVPLPAIHYDPETRKHGAKRATLHAKCVVVDRRWAFVTSANFTEAAQERNIEAGVLLEHPRLAESLAGQFEALKKSGRLKKMAATSVR
jgi:phosphatidylserine/phosphatidylglycerophosphate/cardiolipin synthase-like enzyme